MNYECNENIALVVGAVIGVIATILVIVTVKYFLISTEYQCRDNKLYEVTYDGNITIYDPMYSECTEKNKG